jgi:phosphatidylglycerol lysyltransferase
MTPKTGSTPSWPVQLVAGLTFLNGLFAIFEILFVRFSPRIEALLPFNYESLSRNLGLFAGFAIIYFSGRLLARKRLAWYIAFISSLIIVVGHVLYIHSPTALILPALTLILLAVYRDQFQVESEPITGAQGLRLFAISVVAAIVYGTVGFYLLLRRDFGHDFNLEQSFIRTLRQYSLVGNTDLVARTHQANWFLDSLDAFGILTLAFALFSLFRPLSYRYGTLPVERNRARHLLDTYGRSSEDSFKLWPEDKSYFFGLDDDSFLAYRVSNGVALVLGEAVGPAEAIPNLLQRFAVYCHRHDWLVSYIYLPGEALAAYELGGMHRLKIGEDAIVDLKTFTEKTQRNKHFRAVHNKFQRLGYRFEVTEPPQSSLVLREVADVTRSWLKQAGRSERGFALGYHDRTYLGRSKLYLLRDGNGRLVAFANAIDSYNPNQATIDLMRYRHDSETGVMDFLFLSLMGQLSNDGWREFSLGFAPLAGLDDGPGRTLDERVLGRLSRTGLNRFSFVGLRRYKDKFEPRWEPRYLVYERAGVGLGMTALAVSRLTKPKSIDKL